MGLFSGITGALFNPINLAQLAMGPAGWASIAIRAVGSQVAMNAIQQLGQQMGLPQPMIDMAQATFAQSAGQPGLARQNIREAVAGLGFSPAQQGEAVRNIESAIKDMVLEAQKQMGGFNDEDGQKVTGKDAKGKKDFFTAYAEMMGKKLNDAFDALDAKSNATDWKDAKAVTEFQAEQQKFSFFMTSVTTVIKTLGEALNGMARKQ